MPSVCGIKCNSFSLNTLLSIDITLNAKSNLMKISLMLNFDWTIQLTNISTSEIKVRLQVRGEGGGLSGLW